MASRFDCLDVNYKPNFPADYNPGVGIVGCGGIVKNAHLKAYEKYGVQVVGVYDIVRDNAVDAQQRYDIPQVFDSLDALLENPEIEVVDIATHPAARAELTRTALQAGKHVLSQKPLAIDIETAQELIALAQSQNLKLAVNQNGRWAPPWLIATLLIQDGAIGDVLAVTHLFDISYSWIIGTHFDTIPHWAIYDYAIHWFDITRCWLETKTVDTIRAREYRTPNQPSESIAPWGLWSEIAYTDGASGMIRGVSCSQTSRPGHPFWIHGTEGTIRGGNLYHEYIELERNGSTTRYELEGEWFPDGFGGTIAELFSAIDEDREPYNSAQHNLLSLEMTLAACESAEADGQPVKLMQQKKVTS